MVISPVDGSIKLLRWKNHNVWTALEPVVTGCRLRRERFSIARFAPSLQHIPDAKLAYSRRLLRPLVHSIDGLSKHIGSSPGETGQSGKHVHPLVPFRITLGSAPSLFGHSKIVASFEIAGGPALIACLVFSSLDWERAGPATKTNEAYDE